MSESLRELPRARRRVGGLLLVSAIVLGATPSAVSGASAANRANSTAVAAQGHQRDRVDALIRRAMRQLPLQAVIVQVTVGGRPLLTKAYGQSMTGVPAKPAMHFRNGAVAISYMSTLLLRLVDRKRVRLDDRVSRWLPELPHASQVTLRMLAGMSAGYHDYERSPQLNTLLYTDPFRHFSTREKLRLATLKRLLYTPGTNWSYAHTDYVILGMILERVTHLPLAVALQREVLGPLGLRKTRASITSAIPDPVLHAYSSERQQFLGIPASVQFIEDSTYWNPSWTLARGAIETTDIADLTRTAIGIGSGRLLGHRSYVQQMDPRVGFGHPQRGCPTCTTLGHVFGYGLGVVRNGSWSLQNPLFAGYAATEAYLPSKRISIAVVTTFRQGAYDRQGNVNNYATTLYGEIGKILAPRDAPPTR